MTTSSAARAALLVPVVLGLLAAAGCSSGSDDGAALTSSSSSAGGSAAASSPGSSTAADAPRLEVDPTGVSGSCRPQTRKGDVSSFWGPTVTATGDLTITEANLEGQGVRLLGVDGLTTSMPADERSTGFDDAWPTSNRFLPGKVGTAARGPLAGRVVAAGTQVLPVVGVRYTQAQAITSAAVMTGLRIDYTWDDGSQTASVVLPYNRSFAPGAC